MTAQILRPNFPNHRASPNGFAAALRSLRRLDVAVLGAELATERAVVRADEIERIHQEWAALGERVELKSDNPRGVALFVRNGDE